MLVPARYERNPGIIGRMQGLKNDPRPARKAIARLMALREAIPPPTEVTRLSERRMFVRNWKLATLLNSPTKTKMPMMTNKKPKKYWKYESHFPIL